MAQKLVTIDLDNVGRSHEKKAVGSYADKHGLVDEHLRDVLKKGRPIKAAHGFGGN
jgi:hypothetical protein